MFNCALQEEHRRNGVKLILKEIMSDEVLELRKDFLYRTNKKSSLNTCSVLNSETKVTRRS